MDAAVEHRNVNSVVVDWLRQQAVPLRGAEPSGDDDDLRRLMPSLGGAKVVGLGEANHGTREFFQLKHRLFQFLVEEMGFTAFSIEAPYATGRAVDDYVRHGEGDVAEVLTGLRYLPWDNEELTDLLLWMRRHNEQVPNERKVRFWGVDIHFSGAGAVFVRDFLQRAAPERMSDVEPVLDMIVASDVRFPNDMELVNATALIECVPVLEDLRSVVRSERDRLEAEISAEDCDAADMLMTNMLQWCTQNEASRSRCMAENLQSLLDRSGSDAKAVFWAHNVHVQRSIEPHATEPNAGMVLDERYGEAYKVFVLECGGGTFQTRSRLDERLGPLGVSQVSAAPVESLPWYLEQAGHGNLFLDLRAGGASEEVTRWMRQPLRVRNASWAAMDPADAYGDLVLAEACDGVIFAREVSPARPSSQAVLNAEAQRGL